MRRAYYNEIEPFAAQWLRNLIAAKLIAPGDVDERSIRDVQPTDLRGYRQCHFFAGIGVWSHALRLAGWPDDREVWTGSCPCQPFSCAGAQLGTSDERHLWPEFFRLIRECRPRTIVGEQVASPAIVGASDEKMQRVLRTQALERVSRIQGKDTRWTEAALRAMPEGLRVGLAEEEQAEAEKGPMDSFAKGQGICSCVLGAQQSFLFGGGMPSKERKEGAPVRPGRTGVTEKNRQWGVRADGIPPGPFPDGGYGTAQAPPKHTIPGQKKSKGRLHDGQYQDRLLCRQHSAGGLGRSGFSSDNEGMDGTKVDLNDQRRIADAPQCDSRPESQAWVDVVFSDLESVGYACAAADIPAASLGAPHIRQRLYWVAHSEFHGSGEGRGCETVEGGSILGREEEQPDRLRADGLGGFWRDAEWIACTDGKARPVEPKYVKMADGASGDLGLVRAEASKEGEEVNASKDNRNGGSAVRVVRENTLPLERPPQGRKPREQREIEFADLVLRLPQSIALAQLYGDTATQEVLRPLHEACVSEGVVWHASFATKAPWESIGEDAKDRLRRRLGAGLAGLVRTFELPLAHGVAGRVGKLRAYGNALCAPVAEAFVEAVMECCP